MKTNQSAGILAYRFVDKNLEVFLVHPGGPYWAKKDLGSWTIPKGEFDESEDAFDAARREFEEEAGILCTDNVFALSPVKLKSGKKIFAWALECNIDITTCTSNQFEIEWPPKSERMMSFPEIDQWSWFGMEEAIQKINQGQVPLLIELTQILRYPL